MGLALRLGRVFEHQCRGRVVPSTQTLQKFTIVS
jgi:hypothetical protein